MIFAFMNPVINGPMYLVVAILLYVGFSDAAAGRATPGTIMAAITYTTQLLNGILMLVMLFQIISRGLVSKSPANARWRKLFSELVFAGQEAMV